MRADSADFISLARAAEHAEQLEDVLNANGLEIAPGSPLEHSLLLLYELQQRLKGRAGQSWALSLRDHIQDAVGAFHVARLVVRNADHPEFGKVVPHLSLLGEGEVVQTKAAPVTDQASNKLFELVVALAVMESGCDIEMDDPKRSSGGSNPDVMARMQDGHQWGFACKVLHGDPPKTLFDRIEDGVEQIEQSSAEIGIVMVSFKNRMPHEHLFPEVCQDEADGPTLCVHLHPKQAQSRMVAFVDGRTDSMVREVGREAVWEAVGHRKALPGFLAWLTSVVGVELQGSPLPMPIGFLRLAQLELGPIIAPTRFDRRVLAVVEHVNQGLRVR